MDDNVYPETVARHTEEWKEWRASNPELVLQSSEQGAKACANNHAQKFFFNDGCIAKLSNRKFRYYVCFGEHR